MKKLIIAALLMTLVSASYGQELTYLHCIETDSGQNQFTGRVIIINNESQTWDFFYLLYDRLLDSVLSDALVDKRNRFVNGESLNRRITSITSRRYTLGHLTPDNPLQDEYFTRLDRMSGTSGRTRTATPVKAMDFESIVSTNFTTLALSVCFI